MISSGERSMDNGESWFPPAYCSATNHHGDQKRRKFGEGGIIPFHEYLNIEVEEGTHLHLPQTRHQELIQPGPNPSGLSSPHMQPAQPQPPADSFKMPDFIKVELNEPESQSEQEARIYGVQYNHGNEPASANYTWRHLQNLTSNNVEFLSHLTATPTTVIRSIKKEKRNGKKANRLSLRLELTPWETERLYKRREQNRRRKALQRAQETEEQRKARREKDRLAKAALRAAESVEKRLVRRERDRVAKAISRAVETDEQRRIRREKNRMAMAALRAAQTEEERFLRRERDRIKKATLRAFETEEQKKIRREKNRIAMALRRANRNALRNANPIAKPTLGPPCVTTCDQTSVTKTTTSTTTTPSASTATTTMANTEKSQFKGLPKESIASTQ